jgi:hypothetical protein
VKLKEEVEKTRAEVERLSRELRREERSHGETINDRDSAEEALSQAYYLITGRSPEWSNNFGRTEAMADIDDAQDALRQAIIDNQIITEMLNGDLKARDALLKHMAEALRGAKNALDGVTPDRNTQTLEECEATTAAIHDHITEALAA